MAAAWQGEGDQHQGARPYQEDSWALRPLADGSLLAVVADGMGGHAGGAVASKVVVEAFIHAVEQGGDLSDGLQYANAAVGKRAAIDQELTGMGATLLAAQVRGDEVRWISVGDSPFFLASAGRIERLNADHSMAPQIDEMVKRGLLSEEEAAVHPARHTLREAVMGEPLTLVDKGSRRIDREAKLLLCSDGVQTLSEQQIESAALKSVRGLIATVLAAGDPHQDNVTVVKLERNR
jgi:protein phosphatase